MFCNEIYKLFQNDDSIADTWQIDRLEGEMENPHKTWKLTDSTCEEFTSITLIVPSWGKTTLRNVKTEQQLIYISCWCAKCAFYMLNTKKKPMLDQ